mmetsp:Transcript_606/g.1263  ORF Transcript_606/g.1263 Transcript_606/m.1263 type:complete len:1001 (+) Transcript_606:350-3352(+)|eukprot:CAMPEP_0178998776 /NCGR_PEP_ID=MMETSP0795-20121207/9690_1 /TAXON_ID=88552 /ORGANISM="Amoebophrya sp., Strain Ameob2" /LENGTH=1000 /DNA_ID=CAMNT_0020691471 /DNA_START=329 /DNA_END=3331 /DNA_ORIENTATION=+
MTAAAAGRESLDNISAISPHPVLTPVNVSGASSGSLYNLNLQHGDHGEQPNFGAPPEKSATAHWSVEKTRPFVTGSSSPPPSGSYQYQFMPAAAANLFNSGPLSDSKFDYGGGGGGSFVHQSNRWSSGSFHQSGGPQETQGGSSSSTSSFGGGGRAYDSYHGPPSSSGGYLHAEQGSCGPTSTFHGEPKMSLGRPIASSPLDSYLPTTQPPPGSARTPFNTSFTSNSRSFLAASSVGGGGSSGSTGAAQAAINQALSSPTTSSSTDAVLQKCRNTLELQAAEIERERREKGDIVKAKHDAECLLEQERSSHHVTSTRLNEVERRSEREKQRYEDQIANLEQKLDAKSKDLQVATTEKTLMGTELSSLKGVEERNSKAQAQIAMLHAKVESLCREKEEVAENYQKFHLEATTLEHRLTQVSFESSQHEARFEDRNQRLTQTEDTLQRTRARIALLEQQVQLERDRTNEVEAKYDESLQALKQELNAQWEGKVAELKKGAEKAVGVKDEEVRKMLDEASEKFFRMEKQMALKIKDLEVQLSHQERDRSRLEESFRSHGSHAQSTIEHMNEQLSKKSRLTESLQFEKNQLQKALDDERKSAVECVKQTESLSGQRLKEKEADLEARLLELKRAFGVERDMYVKEVENLNLALRTKSGEWEGERRKLEENLVERETTLNARVESLKEEVVDLKGKLMAAAAKTGRQSAEEERGKWELEKKCEAMEAMLLAKEKEMQVSLQDARNQFEQEKFEMRRSHEAKVSTLQAKVTELRAESCEVRKMIVGAAADLYNSYSADLKMSAQVQHQAVLSVSSQQNNNNHHLHDHHVAAQRHQTVPHQQREDEPSLIVPHQHQCHQSVLVPQMQQNVQHSTIDYGAPPVQAQPPALPLVHEARVATGLPPTSAASLRAFQPMGNQPAEQAQQSDDQRSSNFSKVSQSTDSSTSYAVAAAAAVAGHPNMNAMRQPPRKGVKTADEYRAMFEQNNKDFEKRVKKLINSTSQSQTAQ